MTEEHEMQLENSQAEETKNTLLNTENTEGHIQQENKLDFEPNPELVAFGQSIESVKNEMGLIIVGQERLVELMIAAILADGHILVEGVPGVAKTLASKLLARTLEADFSRIQFTPDLMPSDVLGTSVFNAQKAEFEFRKGPIFSQIVLIDEVNRAPAKTQAALFEVMEERQITMDGSTYQMEPPFIVIATQNPIEQEGTYRLPEAQLDRFMFKIEVGYPNEEDEVRILSEFHQRKGVNEVEAIRPILSGARIRELQELVRGLHIEPKLINYIVSIVKATRNSKDIYLGASPRASLNLMMGSKSVAAMRGRNFVTPEDIQYVSESVLQHRIVLTPEKEMDGGTAASVIRQIVEGVEVPR